jgi:hypothetical protein
MKTIFFVFLLFFAAQVGAQTAQEVRIHQVFEVHNAQKIVVKIDDSKHSLNIKETYSSVVVVEIIIQSPTKKAGELAEIVRSNSYQLVPTIKNGVLTLNMSADNKNIATFPNAKNNVQVIYNIAVPEYVEF